jgi:SAM-dependent methyltransferase
MARDDFYASPFGAIYSAYMERPRLATPISRLRRPLSRDAGTGKKAGRKPGTWPASSSSTPDGARVPLPSDAADLFLSFRGLHCFEDPVGALIEAGRLLKPRGRLVGSCFVRGSDTLRQRLLVRPGTGEFARLGTEPEVEGWIVEAGFEQPTLERSGADAVLRSSCRG